jgi:hypothetical protein
MIIYIVTGILIVLLLLYAAWKFLLGPVRYGRIVQDDLSKFFKTLLDRGYDRGFLVIETPDKKRFLQFRKYIISRGEVGIQFDFPLAPWSEGYYAALNKILYDRQIAYEAKTTGEDPVAAFITVDLSRDIKKANELAKIVLLEVFMLRASDRIKLYFNNINPRDQKVGF